LFIAQLKVGALYSCPTFFLGLSGERLGHFLIGWLGKPMAGAGQFDVLSPQFDPLAAQHKPAFFSYF
jgi:hypothetical protein